MHVFRNHFRDLSPSTLKPANRIISDKNNIAAFINTILPSGSSQLTSELQTNFTDWIFLLILKVHNLGTVHHTTVTLLLRCSCFLASTTTFLLTFNY